MSSNRECVVLIMKEKVDIIVRLKKDKTGRYKKTWTVLPSNVNSLDDKKGYT